MAFLMGTIAICTIFNFKCRLYNTHDAVGCIKYDDNKDNYQFNAHDKAYYSADDIKQMQFYPQG